MKTKTVIKKISAVGIMGVMALGLVGCNTDNSVSYNQSQMDSMIAEAEADSFVEGVGSVDITSDNEILESEVERLKLVLEDIAEAQIAVEKEAELVAEAKIEELKGYNIDDINLSESFVETLDNDDYEKLYYIEENDYNDEDYVLEEKLYLTSDIAPVINLDDLGSDIAIELGSDNTIKYMVEFDQGIIFDSNDAFEVNFLGQKLELIDYSAGDLELRTSKEYTLAVGDSVEVDGKTVTLVEVNEDGDKVYVEVNGVREAIREGATETVFDLEVQVDDVFNGNILSMATLYLGSEVDEEVSDGDDYEDDKRFEWVITENSANEVTGIGIVSDFNLVDEDEVLLLGQSVSLPNEYLNIEFSDILNLEVKDLSLDLNNEDIELEYEGTIEIDGDKIDNSKITFNMNGAVPEYEFKYKSDKYENQTDFSKIVVFQGDRELSVTYDNSNIAIGDYELTYVFGDEFSSVLTSETDNVNDDNDYRVSNGDILYKSDLNEAGEEETDFKIGLKNEEEAELVLTIR